MDPVTAAFMFGTELLRLINSQPDDIKRRGWERWDQFWGPHIEALIEAHKPK